MWFMIKIRNNKDLLNIKTFGYSNIKIFLFLLNIFFFRLANTFIINPITSSMSNIMKKLNQIFKRY